MGRRNRQARRNRQGKRLVVQAAAALAMNPMLQGFVSGRIWQGSAKAACVPGLNCYSCPAAVGSCPLGALQNGFATRSLPMLAYAGGFILLAGSLLGRFLCGWLCPFGWAQDLLGKAGSACGIRQAPFLGVRTARLLRHGFLLAFVVVLPLFFLSSPAFCQFICPAGTLQAGVPLLLLNPELRRLVGVLFYVKLSILLLVAAGSVLSIRPFCRLACPLGTLLGFLNRVSLIALQVDPVRCTHCGICAKACPHGVDPVADPDSDACIRCRLCADACPTAAIRLGIRRQDPAMEKGTVP